MNILTTSLTVTVSFILGLSAHLVSAEEATLNPVVNEHFITQLGIKADEKLGQQMWQQKFKRKGVSGTGVRSCTDCHGSDLSKAGKHITTGKIIKPMSPTVNSKRLTKVRSIEKWFKRNCKWTLGRECDAQEKANFLYYINSSSSF